MIKKLHDKIERFLGSECKSVNGEFTPVSAKDFKDLWEVLQAVIDAKFQRDCNGDSPVQLELVNLSTREYNHYLPVKKWSKVQTTLDMEDLLGSLRCNVAIASDELNRAVKRLEFELKNGYLVRKEPNAKS